MVVLGSMEHSLKKLLGKTVIYLKLVDERVMQYEMKKLTRVQINYTNCFLLIREPDAWTEIVS